MEPVPEVGEATFGECVFFRTSSSFLLEGLCHSLKGPREFLRGLTALSGVGSESISIEIAIEQFVNSLVDSSGRLVGMQS